MARHGCEWRASCWNSIDLGQCATAGWRVDAFMAHVHSLPDKWLPVSIAPPDIDLVVCVIGWHGTHALVCPCRRSGTEWVDASTKKRLDIEPTHWSKRRESINREAYASFFVSDLATLFNFASSPAKAENNTSQMFL